MHAARRAGKIPKSTPTLSELTGDWPTWDGEISAFQSVSAMITCVLRTPAAQA